MKKKIAVILILCIAMAALALPTLAAAKTAQKTVSYENIKITLDGKPLKLTTQDGSVSEPFIMDSTTYVSVRAFCEALGWSVEWDEATGAVNVTIPSEEWMDSIQIADETEPAADGDVHTGLREDGSFDGGTLFIGDSLTYGFVSNYLIPNNHIGDAMYMAIGSMTMQGFYGSIKLNEKTLAKYGCVYSPQFYDMNLADAVAEAGESVTTVYFMMGTNLSSKATVEVYEGIIDYLMESCPNATVFMQTVPYSKPGIVNYPSVNKNIETVVAEYQEQGYDVYMIDTFDAIGKNHNTADGLHITGKGQECWYEKLLENAQTFNSVTE